jgi:hypothetical protein
MAAWPQVPVEASSSSHRSLSVLLGLALADPSRLVARGTEPARSIESLYYHGVFVSFLLSVGTHLHFQRR